MCDIVMGASVVADNGSHLIYGWDHEKRIVLARRQTDDTEWWSRRPHVVFQPEEARRPEVFVYAGKAHPHLTGADLVLTYASIAEADVTLADDSLYFPRFVRLGLE
ncbi:MAG: hypothetical protein LC750_04915 [Actinobacteria bacterium]|nr:hypothetical protein [Actinomycetota bacterium]